MLKKRSQSASSQSRANACSKLLVPNLYRNNLYELLGSHYGGETRGHYVPNYPPMKSGSSSSNSTDSSLVPTTLLDDHAVDNDHPQPRPQIGMDQKALVSTLIKKGICAAGEIGGCSPQEVWSLEQSVGMSLPAQYKEFLLAIGHGAGKFFRGTCILYRDDISDIQEYAAMLMQQEEDEENENGCCTLPDDAFVFSMHQGYEFNFFKVTDGDDPPVYQYVEGNGPPYMVWPSLSDFLNYWIEQHAPPCRLKQGPPKSFKSYVPPKK